MSREMVEHRDHDTFYNTRGIPRNSHARCAPERLPPEVFWVSGVIAVFGLFAIYAAYRRWLVADFD